MKFEDIYIKGYMTVPEPEADLQTLEQVVSELNSIIGEINLELVDEAANISSTLSPPTCLRTWTSPTHGFKEMVLSSRG